MYFTLSRAFPVPRHPPSPRLQDVRAQCASALEAERSAALRDKEKTMRDLADRCGKAAELEQERALERCMHAARLDLQAAVARTREECAANAALSAAKDAAATAYGHGRGGALEEEVVALRAQLEQSTAVHAAELGEARGGMAARLEAAKAEAAAEVERVRREGARETEKLLEKALSSASDEATHSLISTLQAASKEAQGRTETAVTAAVAATEEAAERRVHEWLEAQAAEHTKARLALEAELTCSRSEVENLRQRVAELAGELRSIQTDSESEHAVAMASLRAQLDESLAREANTAKLAREEAARLREEGKKLGEQRAAEAVRATVAECQATSEPRPAKPSPALSRL